MSKEKKKLTKPMREKKKEKDDENVTTVNEKEGRTLTHANTPNLKI